MVHSIEVAQDSQRSEDGAYDQIREVSLFKRKSLSAAQKNNRSEDCGYKISKKTLLYRGKITGEFDEKTHQGKEKCGSDDQNNAFVLLFHYENEPPCIQ